MSRWVRVRIDDDDGEGAGCIGCLALAVGVFILIFICSFGSVIYKRYTDWRIESHRVQLSPDALDLYVGQYDYNRRYLITVERRGDRLFNKSEEDFCELMPISETNFVYRNCVNGFIGQARFTKDAHGQMVMLITHKDGREDRAARLK
jgi:hypothetical protein